MNPMGGAEDGTVMMTHVPTGSGVNREDVGVMFRGAIIGNALVGQFRVADGAEMTAKLYIAFIKKHLEPWHKKKDSSVRKRIIFMDDIAPSHGAKVTTEYSEMIFATQGQIMQWPMQ